MPQVDLETLVSVCSGGGDRKIACEPITDGEKPPEVPDLLPDVPPESFWLSKDAEYDWFDRNAFYERKDSTKGNSQSNLNNTNPNSNSNSSSQRFSMNLKSKASIIGLPKTQGNSYVDSKRRHCKPANIRLFPKRSGSIGKTETEPSSPKVSCMGRVRSKKGRRKSSESAPAPAKVQKPKKSGICGGFMSMFRSNRREKPIAAAGDETRAESPPRKSEAVRVREISGSAEPAGEPPGLGGMMRFSSGRRSATWNGDDDDVVAVRSQPSNPDHQTARDEAGPTVRS